MFTLRVLQIFFGTHSEKQNGHHAKLKQGSMSAQENVMCVCAATVVDVQVKQFSNALPFMNILKDSGPNKGPQVKLWFKEYSSDEGSTFSLSIALPNFSQSHC